MPFTIIGSLICIAAFVGFAHVAVSPIALCVGVGKFENGSLINLRFAEKNTFVNTVVFRNAGIPSASTDSLGFVSNDEIRVLIDYW